MASHRSVVDRTDAPTDRQRTVLDVRSLGPPEPLQRTLETLAELPDEDETDDEVVTVVWRA